MEPAFENRLVVVTGATGALGHAVVECLLEHGAACYLPVRSVATAERLRRLAPARVTIVPGVDFASAESLRGFYGTLPSLWASLHCAGAFTAAPIWQTTLDDYQRMMSANADSTFLCCVEAVRKLRANPAAKEGAGRIVNVAAMTAVDPSRGATMSAYAASKAVVTSLTRSIAAETAGIGLWVNAVAPSIMDTPANRQAMPRADFATWPTVAEVAHVIVSLASPENLTVNGAVVPVTGRT